MVVTLLRPTPTLPRSIPRALPLLQRLRSAAAGPRITRVATASGGGGGGGGEAPSINPRSVLEVPKMQQVVAAFSRGPKYIQAFREWQGRKARCNMVLELHCSSCLVAAR